MLTEMLFYVAWRFGDVWGVHECFDFAPGLACLPGAPRRILEQDTGDESVIIAAEVFLSALKSNAFGC